MYYFYPIKLKYIEIMKTLKITTNGQLPQFVIKIINTVKDLPIKDALIILDDEIDFYVCDLKECHGNANNTPVIKNAWLCDKDNQWSVNFD